MLENPRSPRVRAVAKLAKRAARDETGLFLLEGPQAVREALAFRPESIVELFATPTALERHQDLRDAAAEVGLEIEYTAEPVLEAMADTVTPQGIVAVARQFPTSLRDVLAAGPRLLAICEEVRDPGNLGTIIRAADAAGADAVILTGRTVDPYNPKVVRATTGSLFHIALSRAGELAGAVTAIRGAGLRVVAADVKGDDLLEARAAGLLGQPTAWLFGNEARGLEDTALELADAALRLPIYGSAESLNLATAASVCLYESAFAQRS
ncbi:RNA methyltransferase [Microbacterium sp. SORGH_AS_0862]|uniref:TrmH family RNA methyltransferase n=1 Tax=Microbacterium sp. SORGH_AS_0862 TaxID=3041789 RepID=UPI0027919C34|nr:RNA methyltransferase [Microbacterium sp. SORGH_AS_0862]MDQ1203982.1 TrmH family RNA methyltransferase [Microbacterium sp. SORGH_AS_0862]